MRPLRLQLKGFTSFKEETVVDFAHLDRFVVSGPTGAGKSSLFDAMTFALFSDAPRIDTGTKTDLVSLGKKSFYVALDFRVGSASYRVMRNRTRTGSTGDQPDQLHRLGDGDDNELLATGAKPVTAAVERLLGLTYVHFTQAVFLPQGKFAEFLRARPGERRKLLNELLRLVVYEKMRESAGKEGKSHATHRDQTDRRLREDFAGVTETGRDEIARQLALVDQAVAEADRQLPELRLRWEETRCNYEWSAELEAKRLERAQLEARKPEIDGWLAEVEAATRAASAVPLLDLADSARQAAVRRDEALAQAHRVRDQKRSDHLSAKSHFDRAKRDAQNLPEMRERIQRLAQAEGKLSVCQQLARQIASYEERSRTMTLERATSAESLGQLAIAIGTLESSLRQAQADLAAMGYNEERHRQLNALIESAMRLRTQREGLTEMTRQAETVEARARQAQANVEQAETLEKMGQKANAKAQRNFDDAERQLRAAEEEHKAAHLRAGLQVGEPCPVCRRSVAKLPREEAIPELETRRQELADAEQALTKAKDSLAKQSDALARFRAIAQAIQQQADTGRADLTQREQAVSQQESSLFASDLASGGRKPPDETVVPRQGANAPRSPRRGKTAGASVLTAVPPVHKMSAVAIEDRVIAELRQTAGLSDRYRQAKQIVNDFSNDLSHKQKDEAFLRIEIARLDKELAATATHILHDKKSLAKVEEEIHATAGTNDPVAESTRVQQEIEQIEQRLAETGRIEGDANRQRLLAESALDNCAREAATAAERAKQLDKQSLESLTQARFADASAARDAFRTPQSLQQIKARIDEQSVAQRGLQTRIDELEGSLQGKTVSREQCRQAEEAFNECARQRNESENQGILLAGQLKSMNERLDKSRQLREELTQHERQQVIYDQLAKDLRSDYFQAFLLEETLTGLVRDASAQLMRLTGERYGLFFEEERIFVIDHDNAAERRGIETLSGGETFLASLALALALSEQVQKIAGAVHLDCLFIDEGFGALDPETLRTVSDTIRALQVGGRMVGVITHVPEIKDEFDQRLLVEKKEGVSHVEVEIA